MFLLQIVQQQTFEFFRCLTPETDVDNSCSPEQMENAVAQCNIFNDVEALEACRQVHVVILLDYFQTTSVLTRL